MDKLSYIKSEDRAYNINRCLSLMKTEIVRSLKEANNVVIKPDCSISDNQLACTHVDALESLISFIRPHIKGQIILAESNNRIDTLAAFKKYDYLKLQDVYDLAFVDLNGDDFKNVELLDKNKKIWQAKIARTLVESDFIISICPPKINQLIGFSGTINNVVSASLFSNQESRSFFSIKKCNSHKQIAYSTSDIANENISRLSKEFQIGLSIIDGFETVEEGNIPNGQMIPTHFAIVGTNPLTTDILSCKCLGIDNDQIRYLDTSAHFNWNNCYVAGDDWKKNI